MSEKNYPPLPKPALKSTQLDSTMRYTILNSFSEAQMRAYVDADRAQRLPLTDQQIEQATGAKRGQPLFLAALGFARAIEAAHGIPTPPRPDAEND